MQAAQRVLSLIVLAGGALMNPCPAGAIDRGEVLDQMRRMRPADLTSLETRPVANGTYTLGIFSISTDSADPTLRRYKLWKEYPNDLVIPTESANCSLDAPVRVKRDEQAIYVRRLNPGGLITEANREDHLVWWAACVPGRPASTRRPWRAKPKNWVIPPFLWRAQRRCACPDRRPLKFWVVRRAMTATPPVDADPRAQMTPIGRQRGCCWWMTNPVCVRLAGLSRG